MKTILTNGIILTPDKRITSSQVVIENDRITGIFPEGPVEPGAHTIDVQGHYIIPGLIDIHIHGVSGFDTMDASQEAIQTMARFIASHGVTAYLPTTVAASAQDIQKSIDTVASMPQPQDGARHLGIHLEGPYLNHMFCGAQPLHHLRGADPDEYIPWFRKQAVRLITVAPEIHGVPELIRAGVKEGVEFAIGHSAASYEQVLQAMDLGLHLATHAFNGMPPLHHRTPGVLGAVLSEERLYAQVIVDGTHVHPAVVKLLARAKGIDRTILITDAIRATGMPDGRYALGDQQVFVRNGIARTEAGGLAGSTLTMDQALQNIMKYADLSLQQALPMATRVPAEALGLHHHQGQIAPGFDADIVIMDETCNVHQTMVGGQVVFGRLSPDLG
jgi:N-acetylglucosamine-6-phosphate deacetylase